MYHLNLILSYNLIAPFYYFESRNNLNSNKNKQNFLYHYKPNKQKNFSNRKLNKISLSSNNSQDINLLEDLTGDGGVIKKIIKVGNNLTVKNNYIVKVNYEGKLESGIVFDSSFERNEPYEFIIGEGKVIKGWEIGIKSMKLGEKAKFEILPNYGYKKKGIPPIIPPNAKLFFEIELLEIIQQEEIKKNLSAELNIEVPRTPYDIAKDYENKLKNKAKENEEKSYEKFFFISPFRSQTGQQAPWWLNPNVTFIIVFFFVFLLFLIVLSLGGIHQGYIEKNFDANFLKK